MVKLLSGMFLPSRINNICLTNTLNRQRRYFYYLTGCPLPDSYITYDISSDKSTLYIPPIDPESVIWSGLPTTTEEALDFYDVDSVLTTPEIKSLSSNSIYAIADQISTSISPADTTLLKEAIEECRVVKDEYEVAMIKKANAVSTLAHTEVLKRVKGAKNER